MSKTTLRSSQHYIRLAISPAQDIQDELTLRKKIQDALKQSFGVTFASTYVDVLWFESDQAPSQALPLSSPDEHVNVNGRDRRQAVIRVGASDCQNIMAALAVLAGPTRISVIDDSSFLPALLASGS